MRRAFDSLIPPSRRLFILWATGAITKSGCLHTNHNSQSRYPHTTECRQRGSYDLLDFKIFWVVSAIKSPMREVVMGWDLPGSSGVRWPRFRTFSMAVSMALAAISMRNEYRSIRAAEAMAAMGLARLRPAISGADPCT